MNLCHADCRCHRGGREDVSFIANGLAVGGMVHEDEIGTLMRMGITHVINVNWPDRPEYPGVVAAFRHLDLAIPDDGKPKPAEWFQAGIDFADAKPEGCAVLVHCGHGVNRSPAMAYAILRSWGLSETEAEDLVRRRRPQTGTGGTGSFFEVYRRSSDAAPGALCHKFDDVRAERLAAEARP